MSSIILLCVTTFVMKLNRRPLIYFYYTKHSLDGADQGQRWGLVIHLIDAVFFVSTSRVNTCEQSGSSLGVLKKLSAAISEGYNQRSLQRLVCNLTSKPCFMLNFGLFYQKHMYSLYCHYHVYVLLFLCPQNIAAHTLHMFFPC